MIALDTNVLIYACDRSNPERQQFKLLLDGDELRCRLGLIVSRGDLPGQACASSGIADDGSV